MQSPNPKKCVSRPRLRYKPSVTVLLLTRLTRLIHY